MRKYFLIALLFVSCVCTHVNALPFFQSLYSIMQEFIRPKDNFEKRADATLPVSLPSNVPDSVKVSGFYTCLSYSKVDEINDKTCLSNIFSNTSTTPLRSWVSTSKARFVVSEALPTGEIVFAFRGDISTFIEKIQNSVDLGIGTFEDLIFPNGEKIPVFGYALKKYNSIRYVIQSLLQTMINENPKQTFIFAGHSMGGAMSYYAALDALALNIPSDQMKVITFNAVRAGGEELNVRLQSAGIISTRIVEDQDRLTAVPLHLGFVDQPGLVQIDNGVYTNCDEGKCIQRRQLNGNSKEYNLDSVAELVNKFVEDGFYEHHLFFGRKDYFSQH